MRNLDSMVNGEYRAGSGATGVLPYVPQLPPQQPVPVPVAAAPAVPMVQNMQTGGNQLALSTLATGGNQPAVPYTAPVTGGNQPAVPVVPATPTTGGNQQPLPWQAPNGNTGIVPPNSPVSINNFGPAQTVNDMIQAIINGPVATNARQRGLETASQRGLLNSNMAAGASQRAALESIQPYVDEGMNLLNSREQRALTQNESAIDRAFREKLQSDSTIQQDWLANNAYNREFNGNLSLVPIANSAEFMQYLFQMGAQDPEVYTPNVLAGMQNFFTQNFLAMMQQFFPSSGGN